jgi:hypothetical protein
LDGKTEWAVESSELLVSADAKAANDVFFYLKG